MMEFTLTRTAMCICGVMLMMAVAGPVTDVFEDREAEMYAEAGGSLSDAIDAFGEGEAEYMVLDLALYLPKGSSVSLRDNVATVETPDGEYTYMLHFDLLDGGTFGCSERVELRKLSEGIAVGPL